MRGREPAYAVIDVIDDGVGVATVTISGDVPGLFVVDALARLEMAARQLGWSVRLRGPSESVTAAVDVCGLRDVGEPPAG